MKSFTALIWVTLMFVNSLGHAEVTLRSTVNATPPNAKLKKAIDSALSASKVQSGIIVASLSTGELLFERNGDELLIPASVNKLFTAFAALKKLRPTATFKTSVFITGSLKEGVLNGDLYLKGGGDPSLVSERMWMMVNELKRSGIKSINGNLIGDSSYYDEEKNPESRPKYLKDQAYNAPIGALSFNFNTTTIYVRPGESKGDAPIVFTDPENAYIDIVNQGATGRSGSKNTISVSRTDFVKGDIGDTILLRGSIPSDSAELRFYRNIVNPALYTTHMFKTFLEQRGLKTSGTVSEGKVPSKARSILEFESQPLWQVVWGMNKFSNNFVADQLMKKVGAEVWGAPGSLQKGITALGDALEDIGIPRKSYQIVDGSGLTRETKVSTRQILKVLFASYVDFGMAPEFIASLGIAGEDGTLKRRFGAAMQGELRGKTGSLDGVNSLAGYTTSADGENIAFAIILNDPRNRFGRMTPWIDQVATAITKYSRR